MTICIVHIERQADLIALHYGLNASEIQILSRDKGRQQDLNSKIMNARIRQTQFPDHRQRGSLSGATPFAEGFPGITGFIAGLANGVIIDALLRSSAPLRKI